MKTKTVVNSAIAGVLALGVATAAGNAMAADADKEKCYGVVKAGQNDCGAAGHSCAGQATTDGGPNVWVYLPAGTCEKLVDGSLEPGSA
jgi:uncharacterized membrane protein